MEYLGVISKLYGTIYADHGAKMTRSTGTDITSIKTTELYTQFSYGGLEQDSQYCQKCLK